MPLDHATLPACLQELTVDEVLNRIERLIEEWHSPTLSPIGLCHLLDLSVVQIRAIMALPLFAAILADIRFIQDARREWIHTRAADHAFDRLINLTHQSPTSAAACKEIRLAAQAILEITGPPSTPTTPTTPSTPTTSRARKEAAAPTNEAHNPQPTPSLTDGVSHEPSPTSRARKEAAAPANEAHNPQRARSVSERGGGVFDEPEASAPGLPHTTHTPLPS